MKCSIEFIESEQMIKVNFKVDDFSGLRSLKETLLIVGGMASQNDLDPELSIEDIDEIVQKTRELGKSSFTFEIGESEIEVDIE